MKTYQKIFAGKAVDFSLDTALFCDYKVYDTHFGKVLFTVYQDAVVSLEFVTETVEKSLAQVKKRFPKAELNPSDNTDSLWEKFQKDEEVPLLLYGTSFSLDVWKALLLIPKGSLVCYQWISEKIAMPKAERAVGRAVGANPIAWIVPCHRVIRKDGNISGFFYGVELKKQLLKYEKAI